MIQWSIIVLCDSNDVQIVDSNVKEAGGTQSDDRGAYIAVGDNLYPKNVCDRPPVQGNSLDSKF